METVLNATAALLPILLPGGLPATDRVYLRTFQHPSIHCLTFVSNDLLAVSGGEVFGPGDVYLLNIRNGEKKKLPGKHTFAVWSLSLDASKTGLFSGGGFGEVWYRSLKRPHDVYKLDGESEYTYRITALPGGRCAWAGDKVIVVFDQKVKKKLFNVKGVKGNAIRHMAYVEALDCLVFGDPWELKLVELTKGKLIRTIDTSTQHGTVSFALLQKSARLVNFGGEEPHLTAHVYDLKSGKVVSRFAYEKDPVIATAVSEADGLVITGSNRGTLGVLRVADGKTILRIPAHKGCLRSLSISPDGSLLASCGDDRRINLYDMNKIRKLAK